MKKLDNAKRIELLLFAVLAILVITPGLFDRHSESFFWSHILFGLNYFLAALFINYFIIPRFLNRGKYLYFFICLILTLFCVLLLEEFVLEKIFYPRSRGRHTNLFSTLFEVFPSIALYVGYKFVWDAISKQKKIDSLGKMVAESQIKNLNSQINPHFLFNNLNNLYTFALEKSPEVPDMIMRLSEVLRYMLYDCSKDTVSVDKELDYLNKLIDIYSQQLPAKANINIAIPENPGVYNIAPLILGVFIENAFKHSSSSLLLGIEIDIRIDIVEEEIKLSCSNKYDRESSGEYLSSGIGLNNVKERLKLLYGDNYNLSIKSEGDYFKVDLRLKLWKQ